MKKLAIKHASHGSSKIEFTCCPSVTWPLWPDLISVNTVSSTCTRQLTLYRWFSMKCVLLDVITHSIEHQWLVNGETFSLWSDQWPVTSSVIPGSMKLIFLRQFLQGYWTLFEFCKSAQPNSSGYAGLKIDAPPPPGHVIPNQTPPGRGFRSMIKV